MGDAVTKLNTLGGWFINLDLPAIALIIIFVMGAYVLFKTQRAGNNFDFADMLRDDNQKPSAFRLGIFVCLAISSWAIMYMLMKSPTGAIDPWIFIGYISIWSGVKVAEKALESYGARPSVFPTPGGSDYSNIAGSERHSSAPSYNPVQLDPLADDNMQNMQVDPRGSRISKTQRGFPTQRG